MRAEFLAECRQMTMQWSDYLAELRAAAEVEANKKG
jgi:hypothetical protein